MWYSASSVWFGLASLRAYSKAAFGGGAGFVAFAERQAVGGIDNKSPQGW